MATWKFNDNRESVGNVWVILCGMNGMTVYLRVQNMFAHGGNLDGINVVDGQFNLMWLEMLQNLGRAPGLSPSLPNCTNIVDIAFGRVYVVGRQHGKNIALFVWLQSMSKE